MFKKKSDVVKRQERFGFRKFKQGLASVTVGATLFMAVGTALPQLGFETVTVFAETGNYVRSSAWTLGDLYPNSNPYVDPQDYGAAAKSATTSFRLQSGKEVTISVSLVPTGGSPDGNTYLTNGGNQAAYSAQANMLVGEPTPSTVPALGILVNPRPTNDPSQWDFNGTRDEGIVTFKFSESVTDPIIDLSGLGGFLAAGGKGSFNSTIITLQTDGLTLEKASEGVNLSVTDKVIQTIEKNTDGYSVPRPGVSFNNGDNPDMVQAGTGSIRIKGTFQEVSFKLTHQAIPFTAFPDAGRTYTANGQVNGLNKPFSEVYTYQYRRPDGVLVTARDINPNADLFRLSFRLDDQPRGNVNVNYFKLDEEGNPTTTALTGKVAETDSLKDGKTSVEATEKDTENGAVGDQYDTKDLRPSKITDADGTEWELVEAKTSGDGETGAVEAGVTKEVNYYYKKVEKPGNVVVKYVINGTDEPLEGTVAASDQLKDGKTSVATTEDDTVNGKAGDNYDTTDLKPTTITKDGKTYRLVETATEGDEKGTVVAGETKTITYKYEEVKPGTVEIAYVDTDGNKLQDPVTDDKSGSDNGTAYNTSDKEGEKPATIVVGEGDNAKTYVPVPAGDYPTGKVSETGNLTETTKDLGTDAPEGTVTDGENKKITYVYQPTGQVTAEFFIEGTDTKLQADETVKEAGSPLETPYTGEAPKELTGPDGKTYVLVEADGQPTLKADSDPVTGSVKPEDQVIKYQYKLKEETPAPTKGTVEIAYVDTDGNKLQDPVTDDKSGSENGTAYNTSDKEGEKPATIVVGEGDNAKTYVPVPAGDYPTGKVSETGNLTETTKDLGTDAPEGTVTDGENKKITYVYQPTGQVTAEFFIEGTDTKLQADATVKEAGSPLETPYTSEAPKELTKDGKTYVLVEADGQPTLKADSDPVTGSVKPEDQVIKYQYKLKEEPVAEKGSVVVKYQDDKGNEIKSDNPIKTDSPVGDKYDSTTEDVRPKTLEKDNVTYVLTSETPKDGSATPTGDVETGTKKITYVYKPTGQVTAEFFIEGTDTKLQADETVKEAGSPLETPYTGEAPKELTKDGKTYVLVEVDNKPTLKDGSAPVEGTVTKDEQVIKYQYKLKEEPTQETGSVVVKYQDDKGNEIKSDNPIKTDSPVGDKYDSTTEDVRPKTIEKDNVTYVLTSETPKDGSATPTGDVETGTKEITYVYKPTGQVTAEFFIEGTDTKLQADATVKEAGSPLETPYTGQAPKELTKDGKTYVLVEADGQPTLKADSDPGTGSVKPEDQVIKYQYKLKEEPKPTEEKSVVVVKYVDEEGNTLKEDKSVKTSNQIGEAYDTTTKDNRPETIEKDGKTYVLTTETPKDGSATPTGKTEEERKEVTYVYKLTGEVTAEYYLEGTNIKLADDATVKEPGSALNGSYSDVPPAELTDKDGNVYELVKVGEEPTLKDGSASQEGTVTKDEQVIKYQYKLKEEPVAEKGSVVVKYQDDKGNEIKSDNPIKTDSPVGDKYDSTTEDVRPKTIEKDNVTYVLTSETPKDGSATPTGDVETGTKEITYVYKPTGQVTAEFFIEGTDTKLQADATVKEAGSPLETPYTGQAPKELTKDGKTYVLVEVDNKPTLKDGSAPVEGTVTKDEQVIKYQYKLKETPKPTEEKSVVVVKYVDEDGNTLKEDKSVKTSDQIGEAYDTTTKDNRPETIEKDGKTYVLTTETPKDGSATPTGKTEEERKEVTYVYKLTGEVTAEYYIEGTNIKLADDATVKEPGSALNGSYSDVPPAELTDKDGNVYELVKVGEEPTLKIGSASQDGAVTKDDQVIKYQYKLKEAPAAEKGSVLVRHITESGKVLEETKDVIRDGKIGDSYTTTPGQFDGYTLVKVDEEGAPANGTITKGEKTVTYIYKEVAIQPVTPDEQKGSVLVRHMTEDGQVLDGPTDVVRDGSVGSAYETAVGQFDGYSFVKVDESGASADGFVEAGEKTVTYIYKKVEAPVAKTGTVLVRHIAEDGTVLSETQVVVGDVAVDSAYETKTGVFNGYTFVKVDETGAQAVGFVEEGEQIVTYIYKKTPVVLPAEETGSVLVRHIAEDGTILSATRDIARDSVVGSGYATNPEVFEGYTLVKVDETGATAIGFVEKGEKTVTYIYKKVEAPVAKVGTVLVRHIAEDGTVLSDLQDVVRDGKAGSSYVTAPNKFDGYVLVKVDETGATASGFVEEGEKVVTYIYKKADRKPEAPVEQKGTVLVRHITEDGKVLEEPKAVIRDGKVGDTYTTTPGQFDGYVLVKVDESGAPASGTVTEDEKTVTYVYKKVTVTTPATKVTTVWVTTDGKVLRPTEKGSLEQSKFKGYTFVETVVDKDGNTTHIFTPEKTATPATKVTTVWVTTDGTVLRPTEKGSLEQSNFKGYTFVKTVVDEAGNTTHIFTPEKATTPATKVTTVWVTTDGKVLRPTEKGSLEQSKFKGYTFVETVVDKDGNTTHIFTPEKTTTGQPTTSSTPGTGVSVLGQSPVQGGSSTTSNRVLPSTGDARSEVALLGAGFLVLVLAMVGYRRKQD